MIRARVIVAAAIVLVIFSWGDILLWQRLIEGRPWWLEFDGRFHDGMRVLLAMAQIGGTILLWGNWLEMMFWPTTLFLFQRSGLCDLLYYWLDGRGVPEAIEWSCDQWHLCAIPGPLRGGLALTANVVVLIVAWAALWWFIVALSRRSWRGWAIAKTKQNPARGAGLPVLGESVGTRRSSRLGR